MMRAIYTFIYGFMIIAGIIAIASTMRLVIRGKMSEINSILWFLIGFVTVLAGCFPQLVTWCARKLHITYSPAFVFMAAILLLLMIVFQNTVVISELTSQVQELAIELSLAEEEIENIKTTLLEMEKQREREEKSNSGKKGTG